jgi:hypothetical protein
MSGASESIGATLAPRFAWRSMTGINRFGSLVNGLPYVAGEWPRSEEVGQVMVPWVQLDLDEMSAQDGVIVGSGLLQVWRYGTPATGPCLAMRHISRDEVRADAALLPFPAEAYRAGEEIWGCPPVFGYRGLLWARGFRGENDIEVNLPWLPGEGFAGYGPWQVVAWDAADASIPEGALTEALMAKNILEAGGHDEDALRALAEHAESWREGSTSSPPMPRGWRLLFSVAGSEVMPGFGECLYIWYRRDRAGFEYDMSLALLAHPSQHGN